jgi:hypothetical protein
MDRHDLSRQLEDLMRSIHEHHVGDEVINNRLWGLYQQTSPVPINPVPPKGSTCSCTTTCPHCNGSVTVTLS